MLAQRSFRPAARAAPQVPAPRRAPTPRRHSPAAASDKLSGLVFQPFDEVKTELATVESKAAAGAESLARSAFAADLEAALNEQINIEYNISYVYQAMSCYFARDNVALHGFASYFRHESEEERAHAQKIMDYVVKRGGRVKLAPLGAPETEFGGPGGASPTATKSDALYAMELTLSLEKLNFAKLRALHDVASAANDASATDFVEGDLLDDQVASVKSAADAVAALRRVGAGLGVWEYDCRLREGLA